MSKVIDKNMIRDRALKLPVVTNEMYEKCNYETREIVEEFFAAKSQLSKDTKVQYRSALNQFVYWLHENAMDKALYKVKKRDFVRFMSYLVNRGMSSSGLKFKKSAISSLCKYIEDNIVEDDELPEIEEETVVSAPSSLDVEVPEDVVEEKEIEEVPEVHVEKAKKVEEPVEHVEIKSQSPKISLAALEAQIEEEKKANKGNANRSFHKKKKENEDEEEFEKVEDKKAVNSLPIYTEEELKQFADEEEEDDYDSDEYDEYEEE